MDAANEHLTAVMEYAWTECRQTLHLYHQAQRMCADAVTLAARSGEVVYGLQARLQAAMLYQGIGLTDARTRSQLDVVGAASVPVRTPTAHPTRRGGESALTPARPTAEPQRATPICVGPMTHSREWATSSAAAGLEAACGEALQVADSYRLSRSSRLLLTSNPIAVFLQRRRWRRGIAGNCHTCWRSGSTSPHRIGAGCPGSRSPSCSPEEQGAGGGGDGAAEWPRVLQTKALQRCVRRRRDVVAISCSPPKLISHSPHNHSEVSRGKCFLSTHSLTTLSRGRCALHIPAPPPSSRRPQVRAHLASPKVIFPSLPPDTGRARESLYGIPPVTCPAVCRSGLSVLVKRSGQQGLGRARGRGAGLQPRHVVAAV